MTITKTGTASWPTIPDPLVIEVLGGYQFGWCEEGSGESTLLVEVKQIQDSRGTLTAELSVWSDFVAQKRPTLSGVRVNLQSEQRRSAIAKRLLEQEPSFPWHALLEQVFHETIERYRTGDPGEELDAYADEDNVPVPRFVLDPLILEGVPSVIYGDKGVAKTTLALAAAGTIFSSWEENPFGFVTNGRQHIAALLDWESSKDLTMYAMHRLRKGTGIPYFTLAYRHCKLPLADDLEAIARFMVQRKADTAIIDSLGAACGGDLFKPEPALRFFEALRQLPHKSSLIIAQNSKGEEGKKTIFGSTYFTYYARNIFELKRFGDFDEKIESYVALIHQEANYSGKHDPMGFHLRYTPDSIKIESTHVTLAQLTEKAQLQKRIRDVLREANGLVSLEDLTPMVGIKQDQLRVALSKMKNKGELVNPSRGMWGLAA